MWVQLLMLKELQKHERLCEILANLLNKGELHQRAIEMNTGASTVTIQTSMIWATERDLVKIKNIKKPGFGQASVFYSLTPKGKKLAEKIIEVENILLSD